MIFDFLRLGSVPPRTDRHRLAGTVTVDGLPAKRLITVVNRLTITVVAAKYSDPITGAWEIAGLPEYPVGSLRVTDMSISDTGNARSYDKISQVAGV